jgi:hypothetical protein
MFVLLSLFDNGLYFLDLRIQITTWISLSFAYTDEYKYDCPCETDEELSLHDLNAHANKYYMF